MRKLMLLLAALGIFIGGCSWSEFFPWSM